MRSYLFLCVFLLSLAGISQSQSAVVGDLNGDAKPDVVVGNGNLNTVSIFINNGNGTLTATHFPPVSHAVTGVALADFNLDGHLDILVWEQPGLEILLGDGAGNFSAAVPVPTGGVSVDGAPFVADFNGDGIPDIAFTSGGVNILLGDGHGGFSAPQPHAIGLEGARLAAGSLADLNHDGIPDIVVNGEVGVSRFVCYWALGDGHGGFTSTAFPPAGAFSASQCSAAPDLNGDGNADLLSEFTTYFGDGQGGILYTQPRINDFRLATGIPVDFDHNGTTDFVLARVHNALVYYPGNGHGGFGDPITVSPSQDDVIAIADLNGDGFPDLVLQDVFTHAVSFFINNIATPPSVATSSTTQITSAPSTGSATAPVTLIATVGSLNAGSPTGAGTVTFTEGATTLGTAPVNVYGIAALDFTFAAGLHNVDATFNGVLDPSTNTLYASSSSIKPAAVFVNPGAPPAAVPNITLATSLTPARQLNPVTLTANVTPSAPNASAPSGNVVFKADGDVLGVTALQGTTAILPSDGLGRVVFPTAGLHNIQAVYGGDATFPPATSATLVEDIRAFNAPRSATSVQLTLTPSAPTLNQLVTFHATVVGAANPPASFIYRINGDFLAFALQNPPFPPGFTPTAQGTYTISAEYPGDAVRAPGTASVTIVVGNAGGDFMVFASPANATVKAGQSAIFTITVNPVNGMSSGVSFSCSGLPAASSCTFSPASVTPNGGPVSTTLTLNTTAPQSATVPAARLRPGTLAWSLGIVVGLLLPGNFQTMGKARRRGRVLAGLAFMLFITSCGGGGGGSVTNPVTGTPPGTSTITVMATSAVSHTAPLTLTVTP
jgi:hypothetical protein